MGTYYLGLSVVSYAESKSALYFGLTLYLHRIIAICQHHRLNNNNNIMVNTHDCLLIGPPRAYDPRTVYNIVKCPGDSLQ